MACQAKTLALVDRLVEFDGLGRTACIRQRYCDDGKHRRRSVAPLTYSVSRAGIDLVLFCFAKAEDAQAFYDRFGGERLPGVRR
jgi:hypothetical protein